MTVIVNPEEETTTAALLLATEPNENNTTKRKRIFHSMSDPNSMNHDNSNKCCCHQVRWNLKLTTIWIGHYIASILILILGTTRNNGERKYIPVDVTKVDGYYCKKAYVDVFSTSQDDLDALICCDGSQESIEQHPALCKSLPSYLVLARRLARFPDAWLIPLFPFIIRGCLHLYRIIQDMINNSKKNFDTTITETTTTTTIDDGLVVDNNNNNNNNNTNNNNNDENNEKNSRMIIKNNKKPCSNWPMFRRLCLYVLIILIRGFILYLLFNEIEDKIVSDGRIDCWYQILLPDNHPTCHGSITDFSDHIVLYFVQILAIPLTEVLHSIYVKPYWMISTSTSLNNITTTTTTTTTNNIQQQNNIIKTKILNYSIPIVLSFGMIYLYIITFLGAYKTSAYFHTAPEIFIGYGISLLIQIPLFVLQCSTLWSSKQRFFFGQ